MKILDHLALKLRNLYCQTSKLRVLGITRDGIRDVEPEVAHKDIVNTMMPCVVCYFLKDV